MSAHSDELYDYEAIRSLKDATVFVPSVRTATLVLGSTQGTEVLAPSALDHYALRRRRGGGGVVLLRPGDLWIDFWVPASDARSHLNATFAAQMAGQWWLSALAASVDGELLVAPANTTSDPLLRRACFASIGPGEVSRNGRKLVGITQWRVREGTFLSTLLPVADSVVLSAQIHDTTSELMSALRHDSMATLGLRGTPQALTHRVIDAGGEWEIQHFVL